MSIKERVRRNLAPVATDNEGGGGLFGKLFPSEYFQLNHKLASKQTITLIAMLIPVVVYLLTNVVFHCVQNSISGIFGRGESFSMTWFFLPSFNFLWLVLFLGVTVALEMAVPIRLWTAYRDFNLHLKGSERWATMEELREQYKAIPEKDQEFEGVGGVPVAWDRERNEILIDQSSVNNYIIGTTRSGKGESFIFPTIDIYSRASEKATLIITDPKLELYKGSFETLTKRGYKCMVLNLTNPVQSMRYNPLQTIIDAWKKGDYPTAEELCQTFCYSIFNGDDSAKNSGDNEFWNSTGTNLLSAMILAHVSDCVQLDKEENEKEELIWKMRRAKYDALNDEEKEAVRNTHAGQSYRDVIMERETAIEDDEAFAFRPQYRHEKEVTMYSIYVTFSALATANVSQDKTCLDVYFEKRPLQDRARLKYTAANVAGDKTKSSIYATMIAKLTIFSYENIAKMTSSSDLNLLDVGFGDQPLAIFLSLPDYDQSNSFIATVFLRQLYFVLAKYVSVDTAEGKCKRKVVFLLDEFGNIPTIPQLANIITVCLGRNIHYNLVVQSNQQLKEKYGESFETIRGNCGNWIYLLSGDKETRQEFSDELGNETVLSISRSGESMKLSKSFSESYEQKPLMDAAQLAGLHEGENIVKRVMKRSDLKGNDIKLTPIRNMGNQRFKYRYQYLTETFPNLTPEIEARVVWPDNSKIDLSSHTYDINAHFDRLAADERAEQARRTQATYVSQKSHGARQHTTQSGKKG